MWPSIGAALSLANLYMLGVWDELHDQWFDYFRDVPYQTWPVFFRAIGDLFLLATVFWLLIAAAERVRHSLVRKVCCAVLVAIFAVSLDVARVRGLHFYGDSLVKLVGKSGLLALAGVVGLAVMYLLVMRDRTLTRVIRSGLLFLLAAVPINLASTAWAIHSTWPVNAYAAKTPLAPLASPRTAPKVVWIIFDEWDQYLTFHSRAPGVALPEVDRFRSESLYGEQVFPPAGDTLESLPSLITGKIVKSTKRIVPNDLLLTFAESKTTEPWSSQPNVFRHARELGVNAAMVGFYHPYPRVLGGDLTQSSSISTLTLHEEEIYWRDVHGVERLRLMLEESLHRVPLIEASGLLGDRRKQRIARSIYSETRGKALQLLEKPGIGLVFLHLPVPHPPVILDRRRKQASRDDDVGYDNNLELMDSTLGAVRTVMERRGEWDTSFVLLTSDHPLRGKNTSKHPWIPFLLKVPGQKHNLPYAQPFNSVVTYDLVLAALRGELRSPEEVAEWLNIARLRFPTKPVTH